MEMYFTIISQHIRNQFKTKMAYTIKIQGPENPVDPRRRAITIQYREVFFFFARNIK